MFHKIKMTVLVIFCCFFQDAQGNFSREQLENYFGRPVSSYQHLVDFIVVDEWLYTTDLSKILLVGDNVIFDSMKEIPVAGAVLRLIEPIYKNRFCDTRFENFIKNVEKSSQQELQDAIRDAILLSSASTQAYATPQLLDYLIAALQNKIIVIKNQMKHDFKYDQKSLLSMKKSAVSVIVLMACVAITNKNCSSDDNTVNKTVSNATALNSLAFLCLLPASYKLLKDCYAVLMIDPNAYNQYLDEYQKLLIFVKKLKIELKNTGALSFKLATGCKATVKIQDTILGSDEGLVFDWENN